MIIEFILNGRPMVVDAAPDRRVVDLPRQAKCLGSQYGSGQAMVLAGVGGSRCDG